MQNLLVKALCKRNKHDKFNLPGGSSKRSKRNFPYLSLGVRLSLEFRVLFFPLLCVFSMPIPHLVHPPGYFLPFSTSVKRRRKCKAEMPFQAGSSSSNKKYAWTFLAMSNARVTFWELFSHSRPRAYFLQKLISQKNVRGSSFQANETS